MKHNQITLLPFTFYGIANTISYVEYYVAANLIPLRQELIWKQMQYVYSFKEVLNATI